MYFFPVALFSSPTTTHVTWKHFLFDNLIPVTIGNVIGGAVLVGLVYWFVYLRGGAETGSGTPGLKDIESGR